VNDAGTDADALVAAVLAVPGIFDPALRQNAGLRAELTRQLDAISRTGMRKALQQAISAGKQA
jgi:mannitol-1-phosphate/altronate dehydrogenase